jgi:hypothetical protein
MVLCMLLSIDYPLHNTLLILALNPLDLDVVPRNQIAEHSMCLLGLRANILLN